jgi:hypothetical protein
MRFLRIVFVGCFAALLVMGCNSSSQTTKTSTATIEKPVAKKKNDSSFVFTLRLRAVREMSSPFDDIYIDTNGQMVYETKQQMKDGQWRKPKGFAYLSIKDEDSLVNFIRKKSLFQIDPSDVKPECPAENVLFIDIYRSDLQKTLSLETNRCVENTNLLTGEQRHYFPQFIAFLEKVRVAYRPQLPE